MFSTFCESHATDVPFHVVARCCASTGQRPGRSAARARFPVAIRRTWCYSTTCSASPIPCAAAEDRPGRAAAAIDRAINAGQLAARPAVFVIEDVHWIDKASESMLADFPAVIPQTPSMALITYRPEYEGALPHVAGAQTIALTPLSDAETSTLVAELLGSDPSVSQIGEVIAGRAAGNPFFAQEITRELAERGVLVGKRGGYACHTEWLRSPFRPRCSRRSPPASTGSVRGQTDAGRRGDRRLSVRPRSAGQPGGRPGVDELVVAELVDQVRFTPRAEYAFRHPMIRPWPTKLN